MVGNMERNKKTQYKLEIGYSQDKDIGVNQFL